MRLQIAFVRPITFRASYQDTLHFFKRQSM
jgi:hypothetical protein